MPIDYTLRKRKNAKNIRLSVHPGGKVMVSAPSRVKMGAIESFINDKLEWIQDKMAHFANIPPYLLHKSSKKDLVKYKEEALELVTCRLEHFNAHPAYGFPIGRISIRNQKTRWGSCSKNGNLNFNYKIVLLPPELADYLIVHELCHIGQFNHSRDFWDLVAQAIPDYKERRHRLKKG
jgi:predicted metal-dependent hydrolase